ncbi:MAG TPA: cytochrome b, partial [Thauera aminoaromatica]|nr:cytochrome b [Thauera aminoaromatica]HNC67990.1 cytochrome b [Thauera aminoaromatica]HND58931.1 cytochrome b [Thauera aminoaromatica]
MDTHYTATAKLLHWLIALMIFGMLGFGFYMTGLDLSPTKLELYSWHKWAGVTVFLLVLVRLAWRIGHRPPALPAHMPAIERLAAHAGHHLLYLLMLAIPLSGWLMSSAKGFQTVWFGVL